MSEDYIRTGDLSAGISLPLDLTGRSNLRLKHQVELDRSSQLVASLRVDDLILLDDFAKLGTVKVVNLKSAENVIILACGGDLIKCSGRERLLT